MFIVATVIMIFVTIAFFYPGRILRTLGINPNKAKYKTLFYIFHYLFLISYYFKGISWRRTSLLLLMYSAGTTILILLWDRGFLKQPEWLLPIAMTFMFIFWFVWLLIELIYILDYEKKYGTLYLRKPKE